MEHQYLDLLRRIQAEGTWQNNRTGIRTKMIPGAMLQHDLSSGLFPLLTTKRVPMKSVSAELCGFLNAVDNAATFREFGSKVWDQNANENKAWLANPHRKGTDDLGRIYGVQWRHWRYPVWVEEHGMGYEWVEGHWEVKEVDQLANLLEDLQRNSESRRIIVNAWNPGELNQMALPPCHVLFQVLVQQEGHKLHLSMYQRSCDMFLGMPFNIASYALLLRILARATGYTPGVLTMHLGDVHIYENHMDQVNEQLSRKPRDLPILTIDRRFSGQPLPWVESLRPSDFGLVGYDPHPPIKGDMAV